MPAGMQIASIIHRTRNDINLRSKAKNGVTRM